MRSIEWQLTKVNIRQYSGFRERKLISGRPSACSRKRETFFALELQEIVSRSRHQGSHSRD